MNQNLSDMTLPERIKWLEKRASEYGELGPRIEVEWTKQTARTRLERFTGWKQELIIQVGCVRRCLSSRQDTEELVLLTLISRAQDAAKEEQEIERRRLKRCGILK